MILGHVTRDPEVRTTKSGQNVTSFSIATNRVWTKKESGEKQEEVCFHNIVAWGKLGEICGQYLFKGKQVYIEGRIQTRSWEGRDGVKRYTTEIIASNMILLGGGPKHGQLQQEASAIKKVSQTSQAEKRQPSSSPAIKQASAKQAVKRENEEEINIEDIPF